MSAKATSVVWRESPYNAGPKMTVLLAMADYADERGECQEDVKSISGKARITDVRRTRRLLAELEADGWILRQACVSPDGGNVANLYVVCPGMFGAAR